MPKIIRFNDEYHYWYVNEVQKILTTSDYNSMNNKTLLILNSIDGLRDWAICNTTVII